MGDDFVPGSTLLHFIIVTIFLLVIDLFLHRDKIII